MEAHLYNGLALAYIGDAIYEVKVRAYLMNKGLTKVNDLHKKAVLYTKGEAEAAIVRYLKDNNYLTEEELDYYKRGRNANVAKVRKNISRIDYLEGTGFEALIGYLYLSQKEERMNELINLALKLIDEGVVNGEK